MSQSYYPQPTAPSAPGGAQRAPKAQNQQQNSDIIAKAAVKNKFLDFRHNLIPAAPSDYAMVHGIGGKDHAARSTIKMLITDYSVAQNSVVTSANISPELIPYLLALCEKNVGLAGPAPAKGQAPEEKAIPLLRTALSAALPPHVIPPQLQGQQCVAIPVFALQAMEPAEGRSEDVARLLQMARTVPALPNDGQNETYVPIPAALAQQALSAITPDSDAGDAKGKGGLDYQYRQERVNVYQEQGGLCPVSVLTITRQGLRKNGEVSRMPWSVNITNFKAPPVKQGGGMTSYNSRGIQEKREAFVSIADFEMYRCLYRVNRFIELWEMAYGIPLIKAGVQAKEQSRAAAAAGNPY